MEKNWFSIFLGAEFPAPISGHRREKLPVLGPAVSQSQQSQKKKRTRTMCQICSKLTVKTPEQHQVLLLLMNIAEFEQINASWA